jgi:hypothetical protein
LTGEDATAIATRPVPKLIPFIWTGVISQAAVKFDLFVQRQTLRTTMRAHVRMNVGVAGDLLGLGTTQEQAVIGETPNLAARRLSNATRVYCSEHLLECPLPAQMQRSGPFDNGLLPDLHRPSAGG